MKKLLLIGALSAASAFAAPVVCSGISDVTQNQGLYVVTDGCFVSGSSNVIFSNFSVVASAGFNTATIGITGSSFSTGNLLLDFSIGAITGTGSPNNGDIKLFYKITGITYGIDTRFQSSGPGNINLLEIACSDAFQSQLCANTTYANLQAISTGQAVSVSQLFQNGGQLDNTVFIKKDIQFNNASISEFTNSHAIPEPGSLLLLSGGLIGLGVLGRRRRLTK
jgi:hypothetical protein